MKLNLTKYRDEVVPVYTTDKGTKVVLARELFDYLGLKDKFNTWIKYKIKTHRLTENKQFTTYSEKSEKGRPRKEYIFVLEAAKKIAMGTNNIQGDKVKDYFLECEKVAKAATTPNPLAGLGAHTQRPVQIQNAKAVNRHIWENTTESIPQAIGDYHREATKAVCGKTPSQLKKEAKAAKWPSKKRTSGREVLRHLQPEAACALSLGDSLTKAGAAFEDVKTVMQQSIGVYASIIKLGFTPNELAA